METRRRPRPEYDVVVIGGGPAGSTVASTVAMGGHDVLLLEKAKFPRYAVGESLIVATWSIFDFLGAREAIEAAGFRTKSGATFLWGPISTPWSLYFPEPDGTNALSRNVERADFDRILLNNAARLGVDVCEGARATALLREGTRVAGVTATVDGTTTQVSSKFVVDASGRHSPITRQLVKGTVLDGLKGVSLWTYYRDADQLKDPNSDNILIAMFPWGWFWLIPLRNDITSVGVTTSKADISRVTTLEDRQTIFEKAVLSCPAVSQLLVSATQVEPVRACANYSHDSDAYFGDGFLVTGDAACFIDPILSTGVHLAMSGACYAGYALNTALSGGNELAALEAFERYYKQDFEVFLRMVQDQYELNSHRSETIWSSHRLTPTDASIDIRRRDRLSFIARLGGLEGRVSLANEAYLEHSEETYLRHDLGRYRTPRFRGSRLRFSGDLSTLAPGYLMSSSADPTFREGFLLSVPDGHPQEVGVPDLRLFELCDGKRTVEEALRQIRREFDIKATDEVDLLDIVGAWVDRRVLTETS